MTYGSKHFTVEQVTDGIWTTLHKQGGSHICNSGIIDLGEETLVFDTGLCLESARDLKETATKLTGKTPTLVVNSHLHNDHFYGNQVFTEAEKITSKKNVLITIPKWKTDIDKSYSWAKNTIENAPKLLDSESEYEREYAKIFMGYLQGIIDVAPLLNYAPNDVTFNDQLSLEGSRRRVEIIEYLDGHSESD
jgi:cyclase